MGGWGGEAGQQEIGRSLRALRPCPHHLYALPACPHRPALPFPHPSPPGIYNFMGRNFKAAKVTDNKDVTLLATYLVELSLVDYSALKVGDGGDRGTGGVALSAVHDRKADWPRPPPAGPPPTHPPPSPFPPSVPAPIPHALQFPYSQIAASALYVAQQAVGSSDPYCHTLAKHSGYNLAAIQDCSQHLAGLMRKAPTSSLVAVYKKVGGVGVRALVWGYVQCRKERACACLGPRCRSPALRPTPTPLPSHSCSILARRCSRLR